MGALPRQQCKGVNKQYTLSLRPDERLSRLGKHRFGSACIQIACKFAPDACLYELQRSLALFHISLADGGLPLGPCKLHIGLGDRASQGQSRRCIVEIGRSRGGTRLRSEEHTSALQSIMRISDAVFRLKKKKRRKTNNK